MDASPIAMRGVSLQTDSRSFGCGLASPSCCRATLALLSHMSYAGSGLPQSAFLGNNFFPLKVGLGWVFVNGLKWVQKWVKSGFLGAKVGLNASKPTFAPT